jgi:hypothetical protein
LVQGVDLELGDHCALPKFAIEVKTTRYDKVTIAKKDVAGLEAKARDGYKTGFAVLKLGPLREWIVAQGNGLRAGSIRLGRLETRAIEDLQRELNQEFPEVVAEYAIGILSRPTAEVQEYLLDCLLKEKRIVKRPVPDPL